MTQDIFIAGASARAAAYSALRAGLRPWCADLFADADLRAICQVAKIDGRQYPTGIARKSDQFPPGPWLYTGALENRPDVIRAVSSKRPLWGCSPEAVEMARAPGALHDALDDLALMDGPDVLFPGDCVPSFEHWLIKPTAGAAGIGIREVDGSHAIKVPEGYYAQRFVPGLNCSGLYVGHERGCVFLGATTQLIGTPWLHATGFQYAGSIGLLESTEPYYQWFRNLGDILTDAFGLRGIFGVDCILQPGRPWAIEINPRYTASVEIWEYARRRSALALHCRVFENLHDKATHVKLQQMKVSVRSKKIVGKAILYAREAVTIPETTPWPTPEPYEPSTSGIGEPPALDISEPPTLVGGVLPEPPPINVGGSLGNCLPNVSFDPPQFADLPSAGDRIEKGHPILTLFATSSSTRTCLDELEQRARGLDEWLYREE